MWVWGVVYGKETVESPYDSKPAASDDWQPVARGTNCHTFVY